jgi:hypothetical protein
VTLEKNVDHAICHYARESCGALPIKLSMQGRLGTAGYPDRMFLLPGGRVFFIEMKRPGGKCTPLQIARQQELQRLGFRVYVCDDAHDGAMICKTEANRKA